MKKTIAIIITILISKSAILFAQKDHTNKIDITINDYLGQELPKETPLLFAPGIISTENFEHSSPTFSPDGKEIYWSRIELPLTRDSKHQIVFVKKINNEWTEPKIASFSGINSDDGPKFFSNGKQIYFYSRKTYLSSNTTMPSHDIFYVEKNKDKWNEPIPLSDIINTSEVESSPSFTKNGDILFSRTSSFYFSNKNGEVYKEPTPILDDESNKQFINITPYINENGNMILFGSVNRPDGFGASDLYVSFLNDDGSWSNAINLGEKINTGANERFPSLSPDGRYLFFVSNRSKKENIESQHHPENGLGDIYWVNAKFLYDLKLKIK